MIRYVLVREELDDVRQVATSTPLADLPVLFPGLVLQITVQPDGAIDSELVRPEVEMLRRWQAEAIEVFEQWETLVELVPEPTLGQTKWGSVRAEIERLRTENNELFARLHGSRSVVEQLRKNELRFAEVVNALVALDVRGHNGHENTCCALCQGPLIDHLDARVGDLRVYPDGPWVIVEHHNPDFPDLDEFVAHRPDCVWIAARALHWVETADFCITHRAHRKPNADLCMVLAFVDEPGVCRFMPLQYLPRDEAAKDAAQEADDV